MVSKFSIPKLYNITKVETSKNRNILEKYLSECLCVSCDVTRLIYTNKTLCNIIKLLKINW